MRHAIRIKGNVAVDFSKSIHRCVHFGTRKCHEYYIMYVSIAVNENPSCKKMNITMITLGSLYSSKEIVDRKARDDKKENAGIEN